MTKDLNKGISNISYNLLNLPQQVDVLSPIAEARNNYSYSAAGQKLRVLRRYNPHYSISPVIGSAVNASALSVTKTTDYVGNKIFENNTLDRILVDGGYIRNGTYYFYETDHLGSNRTVINQSGTVVERNDYYPYGMQMGHNDPDRGLVQISDGSAKTSFKFSGKELDVMHGLNLYDFSARSHDPNLGRFTTVDPMAEKYYSISPYAYCGGNPVNAIDPTGEDYWSTSDPEQIRAFLNTIGSGGTQFDFSKGWNHATDSEFLSNLTYNDESGKYYMSYGTVENGEVVINSKSFDTNVTPVSFSGEGYPGAFVYQYGNENWSPLYGFMYDITPFSDFLGPIDPNRYGRYSVNSSGRITGVAPITGMPPAVGRVGSISKTQWGWSGTKTWKGLVNIIKNGGTIESLSGKIPTKEEATMLIKESGGKIQRIDPPHSSPNPHVYDHINYTTPSGTKGTIRIQD